MLVSVAHFKQVRSKTKMKGRKEANNVNVCPCISNGEIFAIMGEAQGVDAESIIVIMNIPHNFTESVGRRTRIL